MRMFPLSGCFFHLYIIKIIKKSKKVCFFFSLSLTGSVLLNILPAQPLHADAFDEKAMDLQHVLTA
jgi:hypothetical protein